MLKNMIIDQSQNCLEYDNSCCSWILVGKSFLLNFAFLILEMQVHFGLNYISCFSSNFGRSVIMKTWKPGRLPSSFTA